MKKILFFILLIPTLSIIGDTNKKPLVEELLVLTNAESTIDIIYSQMGKMTEGMSKQLDIQPSEKVHFDKFMTKMVSLMKEQMSWEKMKEPMIEIYVKHYTEKELKDMVTFYKSESGKSMVSKMPMVMQESMILSQNMMKDFLPKLQVLVSEMKNELTETRNAN